MVENIRSANLAPSMHDKVAKSQCCREGSEPPSPWTYEKFSGMFGGIHASKDQI